MIAAGDGVDENDCAEDKFYFFFTRPIDTDNSEKKRSKNNLAIVRSAFDGVKWPNRPIAVFSKNEKSAYFFVFVFAHKIKHDRRHESIAVLVVFMMSRERASDTLSSNALTNYKIHKHKQLTLQTPMIIQSESID